MQGGERLGERALGALRGEGGEPLGDVFAAAAGADHRGELGRGREDAVAVDAEDERREEGFRGDAHGVGEELASAAAEAIEASADSGGDVRG